MATGRGIRVKLGIRGRVKMAAGRGIRVELGIRCFEG